MGLLYRSSFANAKVVPQKDSPSPFDADAEKEIMRYIEGKAELSGFVFDWPKTTIQADADVYAESIKSAVSAIGHSVKLLSKKVLVLAPASIDSELLVHRICKNFRTENIYSFSMTSSDNIKNILKCFYYG
jgi:hypothetical protein